MPRQRHCVAGSKSEQDNIRDGEIAAFDLLAAEMLTYDDTAIAQGNDAAIP